MDLPPALWLCGEKRECYSHYCLSKGNVGNKCVLSHCSLRLPLRRIHSLPVSEGGIDLA